MLSRGSEPQKCALKLNFKFVGAVEKRSKIEGKLRLNPLFALPLLQIIPFSRCALVSSGFKGSKFSLFSVHVGKFG
jgi:hypothetical protein